MLEDRSIEIWAYNLETVLAEKAGNRRVPRHHQHPYEGIFMILHILSQLHGQSIVPLISGRRSLQRPERGTEVSCRRACGLDEVEADLEHGKAVAGLSEEVLPRRPVVAYGRGIHPQSI